MARFVTACDRDNESYKHAFAVDLSIPAYRNGWVAKVMN